MHYVCFVSHHECKKDQVNSTCISHGNLINQPQCQPIDGYEIGESSSQTLTDIDFWITFGQKLEK